MNKKTSPKRRCTLTNPSSTEFQNSVVQSTHFSIFLFSCCSKCSCEWANKLQELTPRIPQYNWREMDVRGTQVNDLTMVRHDPSMGKQPVIHLKCHPMTSQLLCHWPSCLKEQWPGSYSLLQLSQTSHSPTLPFNGTSLDMALILLVTSLAK